MSANKHNKTYMEGWRKQITMKGFKACILLSINDDEALHMNTLKIPNEVLIPMLEDGIKILKGTLKVDTTETEIEK